MVLAPCAPDRPSPKRVDREEALLLIGELEYLERKLGADRVDELVGRPLDHTFRFWVLAPTLDSKFDFRLVPSAELNRALDILWATQP